MPRLWEKLLLMPGAAQALPGLPEVQKKQETEAASGQDTCTLVGTPRDGGAGDHVVTWHFHKSFTIAMCHRQNNALPP